jgi:hypothetical protein
VIMARTRGTRLVPGLLVFKVARGVREKASGLTSPQNESRDRL